MQNISEESKILLGELKVLIEKYVSLPSEVKRCKHCATIIPQKYITSLPYFYKIGYCSEWCREHYTKDRANCECVVCGKVTNFYTRTDKNGSVRSTGVYKKYCEDCKPTKKIYKPSIRCKCSICKKDFMGFNERNKFCSKECREMGNNITKTNYKNKNK